MQQERYSGAGFQNRDSFNERWNSNRSIDRFAFRSNSPGINHKIRLIDAMDIQIPQRKSDFYQNILDDPGRRSSTIKRSSNYSRDNYLSGIERQQGMEIQQLQEDHRLRSSNRNIHECTCDKQCNKQHCICFLYSNQLCLVGLCCSSCVKLKNQYLSRDQTSTSILGCYCKNIKCLKMYCGCYRQGRKCSKALCKCQGCQNDVDGLIDKKRKKATIQHQKKNQTGGRDNYHLVSKQNKVVIDTMMYSFSNCSCKKSHCLKKYCTCFLNGKSCNQTCTCEDCYNKCDEDQQGQSKSQKQARIARYARHQQNQQNQGQEQDKNNIDQYLDQQQDYEHQQLNQNMQFQPVNFENAGK